METALTRHARIEVPLICGAMYPCSNWELVAAVSAAGGIGIVQPISLVYAHKMDFREGLRKIRSVTDKPIGFNVITEQSSQMYLDRMKRWLDIALEEIERLNSSQSDSVHAHNFMSDMTQEEIQGLLNEQEHDTSRHPYQPPQSNLVTPDWYSFCYYNKCSNVKDYTHYDTMGIKFSTSCKAGYAFAALSMIETNYRIRQNRSLNLAPMQILCWTYAYGNFGCDGGDYVNALQYAQIEPLFEERDWQYYPPGVSNNCNPPPSWWGGSMESYAGYLSFLSASGNPNRDAMFAKQSAMVACICFTTAVQTYSSGVITSNTSCCNMSVGISGWGFSGRVEWENNGHYSTATPPSYVAGQAPPACSTVANCV